MCTETVESVPALHGMLPAISVCIQHLGANVFLLSMEKGGAKHLVLCVGPPFCAPRAVAPIDDAAPWVLLGIFLQEAFEQLKADRIELTEHPAFAIVATHEVPPIDDGPLFPETRHRLRGEILHDAQHVWESVRIHLPNMSGPVELLGICQPSWSFELACPPTPFPPSFMLGVFESIPLLWWLRDILQRHSIWQLRCGAAGIPKNKDGKDLAPGVLVLRH
mmetsp:Transcript_52261/g.106303  ORF Transcript_52261/g.106303 Transcript_52261/m.106303 type:complete len:220 (-) Transcript_52261:410-1069(-)